MDNLDKIKKEIYTKTSAQLKMREERMQADLSTLRSALLDISQPASFKHLRAQTASLVDRWHKPQIFDIAQPLLDMTRSPDLSQLDRAFSEHFDLRTYYSTTGLSYPTVYCESLEEFFTPLVDQLNLSSPARQTELTRLALGARQDTENGRGDILGYNLPGQGAYINGWLFGFRTGKTPQAAMQDPESFSRILETAAHEKLGHGFLSAYSSLGAVKSRLGLTQIEHAHKFGLRFADDPTNSLRREQANLLFLVSQFLEEGWATWVETYLGQSLNSTGAHPKVNMEQIVQAIQQIPASIPDSGQMQQALLSALVLLFEDEPVPFEMLHQAMMTFEVLGSELDGHFGSLLGQPLRYVLGELIFYQAEVNLGSRCVPYAALIAAAVDYDPAKISLSDMRELLGRDPRLHPDTRLAAISRVQLETKNDVRAMGKLVTDQLSLSIPRELQ